MKLKLTEHQHKLLLEFQKRAYSFDWDDNILFMPTKVYLDKRAGKGWVPVSVSTEEFAQIRGDIGKNFRYLLKHLKILEVMNLLLMIQKKL